MTTTRLPPPHTHHVSLPEPDSSSGSDAMRSSWMLLFVYGIMLCAEGVYWLSRGRLFDRDLYEAIGGVSWTLMSALDAAVVKLVSVLVRLGGVMAMIAGVFVMAVSVTAYRRRERWSWYVMWTLPIGS